MIFYLNAAVFIFLTARTKNNTIVYTEWLYKHIQANIVDFRCEAIYTFLWFLSTL